MNRMLLILILGLAMASGCGTTAPPPAAKPPEAESAASSEASYPLNGIVRKVDLEGNHVTIRHDEIPGFMPAMTMPFAVADRDALEALQVGDKVSATLKVSGDHSELVDLTVTEMADPASLSVGPGGMVSQEAPTPRLEPGQAVPDFAMTTQEGEPLELSDFRGKVVVLTFIYTRCPLPDFCPKIDGRFAELARKLETSPERAEGVRLLSVSFDPEHDTPEVLARHAKLRRARPPLWRFAVASDEELRKVARPLGLSYGPVRDEIVHSLTTAVIAPDGTLALLEEGSGWTAEAIYASVRKLLEARSSHE